MVASLKIVYFAWVRERVGRGDETVILPDHVNTVADIIVHLAEKDESYASAFADVEKLRFALDQQFVTPDADIGAAGELAIFPPVTGG